MREYTTGRWGLGVIWGSKASVFPRALVLAVPNAILAFVMATFANPTEREKELIDSALTIGAFFTSVLFWVLYFRSTVAYNRWWEGGTLLQQTRGEWFNAYSSLIAFSSPEPELEEAVEAYHHMLARLMSLLFCSALQQVSPNRNRAFEIIDSAGIDPKSLDFLSHSNDRVEVILQWVQRSTILNMKSGVLPIPPPVMSRAFQEISRGIVNLQNARKIADFPFPFPYAQTSLVMLLIHWVMFPIITSLLLNNYVAAGCCFVVVFFVWCAHFIAQELESPFGTSDNDLPMDSMQVDWNKSLATLLAKRANTPPSFAYDPSVHRQLDISMSDGSLTKRRRMSLPGGVQSTPWSQVFGNCQGAVEEAQRVSYRSENSESSVQGVLSNRQLEEHPRGNGQDSLALSSVEIEEAVISSPGTALPTRPAAPGDARDSLMSAGGGPSSVVPTSSTDPTPGWAPKRTPRMSASQVTAAALSSPRSSSRGSAATRSAISASDAGPDAANRLDAACAPNRLGISCPGMECLSPFSSRQKKPRQQNN